MSQRELLIPGVIIAGLLLLATTTTPPYAYYQFLRLAVCAAGILFAVRGHKSGRVWIPYVFVAVALLFNPIVPIHMSKDAWRPFDLAAAALFLVVGLSFSRADALPGNTHSQARRREE